MFSRELNSTQPMTLFELFELLEAWLIPALEVSTNLKRMCYQKCLTPRYFVILYSRLKYLS